MSAVLKPAFVGPHTNLANCWGTPRDRFAAWHACYDFTIDVCGLSWNAKLPRFWTPEQDGLAQSWDGERVWCNPPYGEGLIAPWVKKALQRKATLTALFLPARTDMAWFHALWAGHVAGYVDFEWCLGRVYFEPHPCIKATSPNERHFLAAVRQ